MKRFFSLVIFMLIFSVGIVSATDVALVVRTSGNSNVVSIINELNYTYDVITESGIIGTDFSNYAVILVQDKLTNNQNLPLSDSNVLFIVSEMTDSFYHDDITSLIWPSAKVGKSTPQFAKFEQLGTPFTEGFSSIDFQAYISPKDAYLLSIKPANINKIAFSPLGSSYGNALVAYSDINNSRKVFFGFTEINSWTSDTKKLFKNSLKWARLGVDFDKDGFYPDSDCNDNNNQLWKYLPGYLDSDGDGFGTGSLLQVCSGNNLASGYVDISGDCNDNSNLINPNALEIPYDYTDNDCKGGDLADIDKDGYCKKGYLMQDKFMQCINEASYLGTDCDENNSAINPSATEIIDNIDQNCRNDNPVLISNIPDMIWNEDENAILNLKNYFADPEGDNLSFSVNKISNQNITVNLALGIANLAPKKDWNGNSVVSFNSFDDKGGSLMSNNITLQVNSVNDAPKLENIADVSVVEGQKVSINLIASDVDGDLLSYSINDTRFSQVSSGIFEWETDVGDSGVYYLTVSVSDGSLSDSKQVRIEVMKKIVINEFLVSSSSGNEWVEIYNPRDSDFDLTGCYLEDLRPNHIPLQGTIPSKGFFVKEMSNILDDDGDMIKLKCFELIDEVSYGTLVGMVDVPLVDESAGRVNDGIDSDSASDWKIFENPTKGLSNLADVVFPTVDLISPVNNSEVNSSYVLFNYTASDNSASRLNCSFFSDVNGSFEKLVSDNIVNGSVGNFNANSVENGEYIWQIKCFDGSNEISSEVWSFKVNSPKTPVIQAIPNISVEETQEVSITVIASDANEDLLVYSVNDTRFTQNDNLFTWLTDYDDAGTYYVLVSVSDGTLTASQTVEVVVGNFNRAPVMMEIGTITIFEDYNYTATLSASDPDSDSLIYSIKEENLSKVNCELNNNNLIVIPAANFYGNASCLVEVSDSILSDSKTVLIQVLAINDAPEIISVSNVGVEETQEVSITVIASDIDGDLIYYSINDTRFTQNDNLFTWLTDYGDSGTHYVSVSVSDSVLSASQTVEVVVSDKNEPPHFNPIANISLDEDADYSVSLSAYDNDGTIDRFEVVLEDASKVDCSINGNTLVVKAEKDWNGDSSCEIRVYDDKNAHDETFVYINVVPVNDAPIIDSYLPSFNPIISKRASQDFSVAWHDIDNINSEIEINWYLDSALAGTGNDYEYNASVSGDFEIKVVVSDLISSSERLWTLSVVDVPQTNNYDGKTTDFSNLSDSELESVNLILEKTGIGRIEFLEPADLRYAVDFDHFSDIQIGLAAIDTNYLSTLAGKIARVTLYGLGFDRMPSIYYDSGFKINRTEINNLCPENVCQDITYDEGTLSFTSYFSSFRVGDTLTCSEKGGDVCSENEICTGNWLSSVEDRCCQSTCQPNFSKISCKNISSNVKIEIREPDDGDDFKVGDNIDVKVRIFNELDKSQSMDVEAYLFDLTDNKGVDDYDKSVRVKKEDSGNLEFTLKIDTDIDESHNYVVFVRAEDDYCNQDYVRINIEREEHDVRITNFNFPEIVDCGDDFEASISVENIGDSDEDVSISLYNSELGIGERVGFELERAGDSDKKTRRFVLFIPDYAEEKSYSLRASVDYEDETASVERDIIVNCDKQETAIMRTTEVTSLSTSQTKDMNQKSLTDKINGLSSAEMLIIIVDMFIILGIIFVILFLILRK
ncbi:MAG: tandem-95 repeat protein [Nanoarchaeota archaeon]